MSSEQALESAAAETQCEVAPDAGPAPTIPSVRPPEASADPPQEPAAAAADSPQKSATADSPQKSAISSVSAQQGLATAAVASPQGLATAAVASPQGPSIAAAKPQQVSAIAPVDPPQEPVVGSVNIPQEPAVASTKTPQEPVILPVDSPQGPIVTPTGSPQRSSSLAELTHVAAPSQRPATASTDSLQEFATLPAASPLQPVASLSTPVGVVQPEGALPTSGATLDTRNAISSAISEDAPGKTLLERLGAATVKMIIQRCQETNKPDFWIAGFLDLSIDYILGRHDADVEIRLAHAAIEEREENAKTFEENRRKKPVAAQMSRSDLLQQLTRVILHKAKLEGPSSVGEVEKRLADIRQQCQDGKPLFPDYELVLTAEECDDLCNKVVAVNDNGQSALSTIPPSSTAFSALSPNLTSTQSSITSTSSIEEKPLRAAQKPAVTLKTPVPKMLVPRTPKRPLEDGEPIKKRRAVSSKCDYPRETRIRMKENPKAKGSRAFQRYANYEKASTVGEYFDLGGEGDFKHDLAKGFIILLDEVAR